MKDDFCKSDSLTFGKYFANILSTFVNFGTCYTHFTETTF